MVGWEYPTKPREASGLDPEAVHYQLLAIALAAAHAVAPGPALWLLCVAVASAGLHSLSDILAGSVEREPWNPTTERAVYNHALRAWHRPRRYVRYSGTVEDLALSLAFGALAVHAPMTGPLADRVLIAMIVVAGVYVVVRHPSVSVTAVTDRLPRRLRAFLPRIRVEETDSGTTTLSIRYR